MKLYFYYATNFHQPELSQKHLPVYAQLNDLSPFHIILQEWAKHSLVKHGYQK